MPLFSRQIVRWEKGPQRRIIIFCFRLLLLLLLLFLLLVLLLLLLSFNVFLLLCCICPSFCFYIYFAVVAAWLRFVSFWLLSLLVLIDFINKSETPVPLHASHQKFCVFTSEPKTFISLRRPKNCKHKTPKKWTSGLRTPKKSELKKGQVYTESLVNLRPPKLYEAKALKNLRAQNF